MRWDGRELAAIFAGGFAGAVARALVADGLVHDRTGFPWATFLVNVAGAFVLGWVTTRLTERLPLSVYQRPLLGTGFCGALTTFSTLQVELVHLLQAGAVATALLYAAASLLAGFAALVLATNLARRTPLLR